MDVQGLHHVSLRVADLDRSLGFYRDVLGFDVQAPAEGLAFFSAADSLIVLKPPLEGTPDDWDRGRPGATARGRRAHGQVVAGSVDTKNERRAAGARRSFRPADIAEWVAAGCAAGGVSERPGRGFGCRRRSG